MCLALVGLQLETTIIIWQSTNGEEKALASRKQGLPGLAYYVIEVAYKEELLTIALRAQEVDAPIKWLTSSQLEITDPDGIVTRIRLAKIKLGISIKLSAWIVYLLKRLW